MKNGLKAIVNLNYEPVKFTKPMDKLGKSKSLSIIEVGQAKSLVIQNYKMSSPRMLISSVPNRSNLINFQATENEFRQSQKFNCGANFNEYLYNSSLHGLRYVSDRKITRFER